MPQHLPLCSDCLLSRASVSGGIQDLRYANDRVQSQLTAELVQAMAEKCFKQCCRQPSEHITRREETCLQSCNDKFLASRQLIAEVYGQLSTAHTNSTAAQQLCASH